MAAVTITVLRLTEASLSKTWLNAGKSEYPTLLALKKGSENMLGADNQQERLEAAKLLESSETTRRAPVMSQVKI